MLRRTYRVKDVARVSGVSARTLHYYDEIGLLTPSARTDSGYRLYNDSDVARLQQILIWRELGLALEEIRRSLDDPRFDRRRALAAQRHALEGRAAHTAAMLSAVDKAIAAIDDPTLGQTMDTKELFDGFDPQQYEAEAQARWGQSDEYRSAMKRTKNYSKEDWRRVQDEQGTIYGDAFKAMTAGKQPSDDDVTDIAERHRKSIERWFYPCSLTLHASLADMYEADPRFAGNINKFGVGLTPFLAAAIRANGLRRLGSSTS